VPDTWTRDYAELRSKNEITGQVDAALLILTLIAMIVFLVLRIRRGDVRWKAATKVAAMSCARHARSPDMEPLASTSSATFRTVADGSRRSRKMSVAPRASDRQACRLSSRPLYCRDSQAR